MFENVRAKMKSLSLTRAFARYNAKLRNVRWAYSAISTTDGSVVISCWDQYLSNERGGILRYDVTDFSRWTSNPNGKKLLLRFAEDLAGVGSIEGQPRLEGRNAHLIISPVKGQKDKPEKPPKEANPQNPPPPSA